MVDKKIEDKEILNYADEISKKVLSYQKTKKFHYTFLKNLNDLLANNLDSRELAELEKVLSDQYNNKLKVNHKKTNAKTSGVKKVNMKNEDDDGDDGYYDEDEDVSSYSKFK